MERSHERTKQVAEEEKHVKKYTDEAAQQTIRTHDTPTKLPGWRVSAPAGDSQATEMNHQDETGTNILRRNTMCFDVHATTNIGNISPV